VYKRQDSRSVQERPSRKKRDISAKGKHWSDSQKLEAVQLYLMLGNLRATAAALRIPEITVKVWRTSAWWKELEAELKLQDELQLSARLKKIAARAFDAVEDRLEHGNFVFDQKTGEVRRIPVNVKDAHKVASDAVAQQYNIARRQVEVANDGQIERRLMQLAEKFAELATKKITQIQDDNRTIEMVEEIGEDYDLSGDSLSRDAGREENQESMSHL
jgi:hypothetical protein